MSIRLTNRLLTLLLAIILVGGGGLYILYSQAPEAEKSLVVATTTSLYDTGILDRIEDAFEAKSSVDLYLISVGTGLAITHAQRGDADMILVHAPSKELQFMEEGYGVDRKIIAYNFFSIVGPSNDPVGINNMNVEDALSTLIEKGRSGEAIWVSRGDDSGTHAKEKDLWSAAGYDATSLRDEDWYRESGTGMGKTLQIAEEFDAHTLTDMGTYLKYRKGALINLEVVVGEGEKLINVYSAIAVSTESNTGANFVGAIEFIEFLVSDEGQAIFESFGVDTYDTNLINPAVKLIKTGSDPDTVEWIEAAAYFEGSECPERFRSGDTKIYD
ncbi:MAG: substrate-binding domain-containing protein [Candidatus Bathyarchaeota archaeon]|nr:MAG: substrate-binding domain-containing protein [Candidatus Bathyarchaeota archaeon]